MLIQVLRIETGDGKTLYTKEVNGPHVARLARQIEARNQGVKVMELIEMHSSAYYDLNVEQLAILELNS